MAHTQPVSLETLTGTGSLGMKKSFSIDSSLSMVSHHAAVRTHPDRPAEHSGHGMGLTGLKTLHEDRRESCRGLHALPVSECE